jgi:endonuclease YncB( thermonuclease family)
LLAKKRLKELLPIGSKQIVATTLDKEKFGRTLGDFSNAETKSLTKLLLSEGHAIEYCDDKELRKQRFEINRIKIDKQYA